ncbi:MAG: E3 ubiquitin ligase family protein [Anaerolineales bacterium]|nr:E3 ubiquitin ligase family protein [Anaerolineales bacterium]
MNIYSPDQLFAILWWLGVSVCCGLPLLLFAAILFFTARKRGQTGSAVKSLRTTTVAALHPGAKLARLHGRIASPPSAIDGPADAALVYLRLTVEFYDPDDSEWKGWTDKARGVPFQLEDGSGAVWVNPDGLDKHLLGKGIAPNDDQIQAACLLLGISPNMPRGELSFRLWEFRAGQTITVVGAPLQGPNGLTLVKASGQPFIVSPLAGTAVESAISTQTKTASVWTFVLGIPGLLALCCGLGGAAFALIKMLSAR